MAWKDIKKEDDLKSVAEMFEGGAKLVSVSYVAAGENSDVNDVREAIFTFRGEKTFKLKFSEVDCVHVAPISMGSIYINDIAIGKFGNLFFWADDGYFNITEPDTSLTYAIAKGISLEK